VTPGWKLSTIVLVEVLAGFIRQQFPCAFCPACIATSLLVTEKEIREASQLVVVLADFGVTRGTCVGCGCIDDIVERRAEAA
jgi:hypothetical protein